MEYDPQNTIMRNKGVNQECYKPYIVHIFKILFLLY